MLSSTNLHEPEVGVAGVASLPTPVDLLLEPVVAVSVVEEFVPGADLGDLEVGLLVALDVVAGRLDGRRRQVDALPQGGVADRRRVLEGEILAGAPGRAAGVAAALLNAAGLSPLGSGGRWECRGGGDREGQVDRVVNCMVDLGRGGLRGMLMGYSD